MKPSTKPWPLKSIHGIRNRINTNPDFQRPAVWGLAQKQLLIDSILRDYDIPENRDSDWKIGTATGFP